MVFMSIKPNLKFIESKSFEVLHKNELTQKEIFKVDNAQDLYDLDDLIELPNVKVLADIKFSRQRSM